MLSNSILLPLNIAVIPAAYLYGTGTTVQDVKEWFQQWRSVPSTSITGSHLPDINGYVCQNPPDMRPMFLSYEPIMVYLENFISELEADYLKKLAIPLYETSELRQYEDDGSKVASVDEDRRRSETAWLPSDDPVVACVRSRAASFEGHAPNATLDALAALRYTPGGHFDMHHDWDPERKKAYDRRTSFFVTLAAEGCVGGSTYFPHVRPAWTNSKIYGRPWCKWVDCSYEEGVAVKPIQRNAVFWVNFREDGTGIPETVHSGQPLLEGTKVGMNIWTWSMIGAEGGGIPEE